ASVSTNSWFGSQIPAGAVRPHDADIQFLCFKTHNVFPNVTSTDPACAAPTPDGTACSLGTCQKGFCTPPGLLPPDTDKKWFCIQGAPIEGALGFALLEVKPSGTITDPQVLKQIQSPGSRPWYGKYVQIAAGVQMNMTFGYSFALNPII